MDSKIKIENLHKQFGSKKVIKGLDLKVKSGESYVIIGGSGTGKSVTLKCMLGLITPDQGSITINSQEVVGAGSKSLESIRQNMSMLFQGGALFDSLPVWENVAFRLLQLRKFSRKAAKEIAIEKLASVGLSAEVALLSPAELSGGMQKRVSLARSIASDPEIIFFDEPTTGLDPIMGGVINNLIRDCVSKMGATAVTITHDMSSVRAIADRVGMLYNGKIIWEGSVDQIDNPENDYVSQFIHGQPTGPIQMAVGR